MLEVLYPSCRRFAHLTKREQAGTHVEKVSNHLEGSAGSFPKTGVCLRCSKRDEQADQKCEAAKDRRVYIQVVYSLVVLVSLKAGGHETVWYRQYKGEEKHLLSQSF